MKAKMLSVLAVSAVLLSSPALRGQSANDLHATYEEGRAAYNAGQYDVARQKLNIVKAKNPTHVPTLAMLTQIEQALGADNTVVRKSYEGVIIDKIEFSDVDLSDAIQAVRVLSKRASNEKIVPNIILKSPDLASKKVSISLSNVPLSEVLNYLAQLAGARLTYDKVGVVFSNLAG